MENFDPTLMARIEKEGVGPFLRHMREEKEVSLRAISDHTRIRTYYLESIERGDFDRLPAGPVGLGFIRAYADAVDVDSNVVAANYKRETSGEVPLEPFGLEPESRTLYSPVSRVNRFSSVATFAFVLIFLLAGGGILWFMKGRTDQLVPIGSIVDRIKTVVDPVVEKLPQLNNVNEKANNEDEAGRGTDVVEKKVPEQERPVVPDENLKEPVTPQKAEKPSPAEERPPLQASVPARQNTVAEQPAPAQESPSAQVEESPPVQAQESPPGLKQENPPAQASAQPEENPSPQQNPSAPASTQTALNTAPNTQQAPPQKPQTPADSEEVPLNLKIFATEDTWLRIVVDSKNTEELLLLAGNEKNWKASDQFVLTVGNVAGAQVSLNGSEVALPKNSSNVLRDFIIPKKSLN